jgi:single-strand DNA-binding protein
MPPYLYETSIITEEKMRGVNKVILVGNVGANPEVHNSAETHFVRVNFTVATSFKTGDTEYTEWHKIVCFNKLAVIMEKYLSKGCQVYVEGHLQTRKWTDKEGATRWTTEIIAHDVQLLGSKVIKTEDTKQSVAPANDNNPTEDEDSTTPF